MIRVPQNGKFSQPNKGELFGNLAKTQGVDLRTNPGVLRITPRLVLAVKDNDTSISNMGVPCAIATHDNSSTKRYWIACGLGNGLGGGNPGTGRILVSDDGTINGDYDIDGIANSPTVLHADFTDMVAWRDGLFVSTYDGSVSQISRLVAAWTLTYFTGTASGTFGVAGGIKNLCVGFNGNLYFTDDDEINYISTADAAVQSGAGTVDMAGQFRAIWIRSSSNRLWIGLMDYDSNLATRGYVAEWDGTGTAFNRIYDISAPCALSCVIKDDVPYIIDAYGRLKAFNGGAFVEVARLPVANLNIEMPGIYNDLTNARWIHHRGMDLVNGKININVNNFVSTGVYVEEMPSGVWEYDEEIGLYHKASPCSTANDWGQKQVSIAGAIYGSRRTQATFLAGYAYYSDNATTTRYGIFYDDIGTNTNKRALVTLPFINSPNMQDVWQKVGYRFRPLQSGDKIIGKYRTRKHATLPLLIGITWTSTTTCTTTTNVSAYDPDTLGYNPELETVMGEASGTTSEITDITNNAGTYTITLKDTIGQASGSGKAYITNFKTISTISDTAISEQVLPIGDKDTKIQIKTELRGTGDFELDDITLINQVFKHNA